MRKTLEAKKGAKLMIESIRRTISPLPNVLNTNQPDVCNIILLSLLLLLRRRRLHFAPTFNGSSFFGKQEDHADRRER